MATLEKYSPPSRIHDPCRAPVFQRVSVFDTIDDVVHSDPDRPGYGIADAECGESISYNKDTRKQTLKWAMAEWLKDEHQGSIWHDIIVSHFGLRHERIGAWLVSHSSLQQAIDMLKVSRNGQLKIATCCITPMNAIIRISMLRTTNGTESRQGICSSVSMTVLRGFKHGVPLILSNLYSPNTASVSRLSYRFRAKIMYTCNLSSPMLL